MTQPQNVRNLDTLGQAAALVRAACGGDVRTARALLDAEPGLARFDFHTACATGEADAVAGWLARDPSLARGKGGPLDREPILYACFSRLLRSDPLRAAGIVAVVRLLLHRGADPNSHYFMASGGETWIQTALYGAAGIANNAHITRMLLEAGADVNELQPDPGDGFPALGTEALYHASEFPDTACLRLLLEAKPHARRVSYCLGRALDFAEPAAALLYLEHGADPNFRVPWQHNRTHLHKAVVNNRALEVIARMIDAGGDVNARDDRGDSLYRSAVRFGHAGIASLLERRGARADDVTHEDRVLGALARGEEVVGATVSPHAAADVLCRAAHHNDVAALRRLLDAGADPDATGGDDNTPALHWACWRGQLDAARLLVERGASLTRRNCYGGDALGTTIHGSFHCHDLQGGPTMRLPGEVHHGDYAGIVEMLIAAGAALPKQVGEAGDPVKEVLRRHGVPDQQPDDPAAGQS